MANDVGKLRRSTVVSTFAPGAVVDFRADGAAISGVVAGLEEWDASFPQPGLANPQKIYEPRLQHRLGVSGFRLPPVIDEDRRDKDGNPDPDTRRLVATRFPDWLQCPRCDRIAPSKKWSQEPGKAYRYCAGCTSKAPGGGKVFVVPVRFVMACEAGHLDDFPWRGWVKHLPTCKNTDGFLWLKARRPGLAGLFVTCTECKEARSLDGIFTASAWEGSSCRGRRPWLAGAPEKCEGKKVRAMQRGASNLFFPALDSALSIPPWSDVLQEALGDFWDSLVKVDPEQRAAFIRMLAAGTLGPTLQELGMSPDNLAAEIERRVRAIVDPAGLDIRGEEYRQFTLGAGHERHSDKEFETRAVRVPAELRPYFSRIVRVVRLREVRAVRGFTRIDPPGDASVEVAPISRTKLNWLPAIEVRGEGIFLEFAADRLVAWETDAVRERAAQVHAAWAREWASRGGDGPPPKRITPRFLLVHTFAHVLMRQLTLDCGYSSASLRERLYVGEGESDMAGLLVYTATPDADGTLGGLQRQAEADRIARTVPAAVRSVEWCSSDPLCIEGLMGGADDLSLAACHACVLAPETACEEFNRFLDRATIVGTPQDPGIGYFSPLLRAL